MGRSGDFQIRQIDGCELSVHNSPKSKCKDSNATRRYVTLSMSLTLMLVGNPVHADEGGVSFWAPGQFGSFVAVPEAPGLSMPLVYIHTSADASASKSFIRGGLLTAGLETTGNLLFLFPTYTFKEPLLGGRAAFGLGWAAGHIEPPVLSRLQGRWEIPGLRGAPTRWLAAQTFTDSAHSSGTTGTTTISPIPCSVRQSGHINSGVSPI